MGSAAAQIKAAIPTVAMALGITVTINVYLFVYDRYNNIIL